MIYGDNPNKINEREDALGLKVYTYAPSIGSTMQSGNLYVYCLNDPVKYHDDTGEISHIVIGTLVGFVAGIAAQVITDVATSIINDELSFSSLETYVGAAIGGAAGGAVLATTGNTALAGATTGFIGSLFGQAIEKWTGKNEATYGEIFANSFVNGAISGAFTIIPAIKIPGFTSGRNSFSAVYQSGMTKLKHNIVSRMSAKVIGKGLAVDIFNGIPGYLWVGYMASDCYDNSKAENDKNNIKTSHSSHRIMPFYHTLY